MLDHGCRSGCWTLPPAPRRASPSILDLWCLDTHTLLLTPCVLAQAPGMAALPGWRTLSWSLILLQGRCCSICFHSSSPSNSSSCSWSFLLLPHHGVPAQPLLTELCRRHTLSPPRCGLHTDAGSPGDDYSPLSGPSGKHSHTCPHSRPTQGDGLVALQMPPESGSGVNPAATSLALVHFLLVTHGWSQCLWLYRSSRFFLQEIFPPGAPSSAEVASPVVHPEVRGSSAHNRWRAPSFSPGGEPCCLVLLSPKPSCHQGWGLQLLEQVTLCPHRPGGPSMGKS